MKRFLASIITLLLVAQPAFAMTRPIFSTVGANTSAAGNRWISFDTGAGVAFSASDASMRTPISINGTIGDAIISNGALAVGASYIYTLYKNGSATGQTCTIANPATTCTATGGTSIVPGDRFSWSALPQGGAAATNALIITSLVGSNADETSIGGAVSAVLSNSTTQYYSPFGVDGFPVEASSSIPEPVAGTIDSLYVETSIAAGVAKSYDFTLYKNGVATGLTTQIAGNSQTTNNDTTHTVTVTANDTLSMEVKPTGTPSAPFAKWSVRLAPTVDGQSPIWVRISPPTSTANRFYSVYGKSNASSGAVDIASPIAFAISNLYTTIDIPPGGIAAQTTVFRQNGSASALTATVNSAGTPGSDNTHTISVSANDTIGWGNNRTSTPATAFKQTVSAIAFVTPSNPVTSTFKHFFQGGSFQIFGGSFNLQ